MWKIDDIGSKLEELSTVIRRQWRFRQQQRYGELNTCTNKRRIDSTQQLTGFSIKKKKESVNSDSW